MKIKKGDKVQVMTGKDKGVTGTVQKAFPREDRVLVEGVNIRTVHERAKRSGQKGQLVKKAMPIHASNVMRIDPKSGKPTRTIKK